MGFVIHRGGDLRSGVFSIAVTSWCDVWVWPIVVVSVVGVVCAYFLRWAGVRRPGTAAGLATGLLCGLTVLGNMYPNQYHQWFTGGTEEQRTLEEFENQHRADLLALTSTGVSPVAIAELKEQQRDEIEKAEKAHSHAMWNHQRGLRVIGLVCAGFVFGWLLPLGWKKPESMESRQSTMRIEGGGGSDAFFIHWWMVIFVTGFVGALMLLVFHWSRLESLAVGLTFAVPCTGLRNRLCGNDHHSEGEQDNEQDNYHDNALVTRVAFIGWVVALLILISAFALQRSVHTTASLSPYGVKPITALIAGSALAVGVILRLWCSSGKGARVRGGGFISLICSFVFVPLVTAVLCLHVDLLNDSLLWPVIPAMLVGGDGRWFTAACGLRMTGRPWRKALNGALDLADAGAMQVVVGFVLLMSGWITGPVTAAVVVAGAVVGDVTVEKRQSLIRKWQAENENNMEMKG